MRDVVVEHEEELGRLDAIAGDGDHGIGMRRGVDAAVTAAEQAAAADGGASPARVLTAAGEAWSERAGGTSGALWGSAVIAAGLALGNRDSYSGGDAAAAVTAFVDAITELGKADAGRQDHGGRPAAVPGRLPAARSTAAPPPPTRSPPPRPPPRPPRTGPRTSARSRDAPGRSPKRAWATPTPARCPSP